MYLITGGAGFIGSHIAERLVKEGKKVRIFDNFSTGKLENLENCIGKLEIIEGDLRDINQVKSALKGVDYILHQGALPSVPLSIEKPVDSNSCNITGTLNLLVCAKEANIKRCVVASSSSVYGESKILPKVETMPPSPLSPYALQKFVTEKYALLFYDLYGLETVALRYFNVFGPRQNPKSQYAAVIPKFISMILNGERPIIYGDGLQTRDFTYIENVVEANLLALYSEKGVGYALNIASGKQTSLNELVEKLSIIAGYKIEPIYEKERKGDIKHSYADISNAKKLINYSPKVDLEQGLKITYEWFKQRG